MPRTVRSILAFFLLTAIPVAHSQTAATEPKFEIVSIRPSGTDAMPSIAFTSDGMTASHAPLQMLITFAYDETRTPDYTIARHLMPGGPAWILSEQYDIQARIAETDLAALRKLDPAQRMAQRKRMVQALLADRFQLKMHFEPKEMPSYALVVAKGGPKNLKQQPEGLPQHFDRDRSHLHFQASPMSELAQILSLDLLRPVVDETMLTGNYDFALAWALDADQGTARGEVSQMDAGPNGPTIFTALQEQLGLKLVAKKTLIPSPVIDATDRPTPN